MICLLVGEAFVGYDPLNIAQVASTISSYILLFVVGLASYSKLCWRREWSMLVKEKGLRTDLHKDV